MADRCKSVAIPWILRVMSCAMCHISSHQAQAERETKDWLGEAMDVSHSILLSLF